MNHTSAAHERPPIRLLHAEPPAHGQAIEVAPGLFWTRVPLPFRLNHVNVWLLDEGDGWTVIDTGVDTEQCRAVWQEILARPLAGKPVRQLVATHGHTDHVGLAGWIVDRFDCPFVITLGEWQAARIRQLDSGDRPRPWLERYLAQHGCDAPTIEAFKADRFRIMAQLGPQPDAYRRINAGDEISMGGRRWRVIVAGGHADEHASFWCEADRILIAGDQILQRISPVVGVHPGEPDGNPLGLYLTSLGQFRGLSDEALVLPSHGLPFFGLHRRIAELAQHHAERLDRIIELIASPRTGTEVSASLFARAVADGQGRLALAETLSHLHYLAAEGRAERIVDDRIRFLARQR